MHLVSNVQFLNNILEIRIYLRISKNHSEKYGFLVYSFQKIFLLFTVFY